RVATASVKAPSNRCFIRSMNGSSVISTVIVGAFLTGAGGLAGAPGGATGAAFGGAGFSAGVFGAAVTGASGPDPAGGASFAASFAGGAVAVSGEVSFVSPSDTGLLDLSSTGSGPGSGPGSGGASFFSSGI